MRLKHKGTEVFILLMVILTWTGMVGCALKQAGEPAAAEEATAEDAEDETAADSESEEDAAWNERIDAAFESSECPDPPEREYDGSYYSGLLIDSHLHIAHLPTWDIDEEDDSEDGVMPVLGVNSTIPDIFCTLQWEGTEAAFAFFPVYTDVPTETDWPALEVVRRTMELYPDTPFVPYIMPPGDDVGTANAEVVGGMLEVFPGLFNGYGEIGLYETEPGAGNDLPPDSPIFDGIYELILENNLMIYFHTGNGHADNLRSVLQQYPDINFVVHGEQIEQEIGAIMDEFSNIYFTVNDLYGDQYLLHGGETTESFLEATEDYETLLAIDQANWQDLIEAHPDQFLWGTDRGGVAVWTLDREVGERLSDYTRAFIGRLDPSVQEKFAYQNAQRIIDASGE